MGPPRAKMAQDENGGGRGLFDTIDALDAPLVEAYLRRLGVAAEPPSAEALRSIVRRHAERVPYETLWIPAGERWSTDPTQAAVRIALAGRGGYCYHLNGALGLLLSSLGYDVHGHVGGVQAGPPNPDAMGNHLALTVTGLPSEDNPSGTWYVDTGLGDALHEPLPLVEGTYVQGPFRLTLEQPDDLSWTFTHDPAGGFRTMTWTTGPARASDFTARHEWLSTAPESGFVRVPIAERRDATGVDVVRGLVLSRIGTNAFTGEPITRPGEWFDALADVIGLRFETATSEWRNRLWEAVLSAHRAWEESQAAAVDP
ncbi:MAG TPA: arylamine N-acetyltransferase [Marmoricola sp.]|nr:arylamine N-acetyltransferase [Marmoricola sp.]